VPRSTAQIGFSIRQIQQRARDAVQALLREIGAKEAELQRLRDEEPELTRLAGVGLRVRAVAPSRTGRRNWRTVLERLPNEFKASQVRTVQGLENRQSSEIFAGITRWIDAGLVKRKERGVYQRLGKKAAFEKATRRREKS
jgi:hypothetical protein